MIFTYNFLTKTGVSVRLCNMLPEHNDRMPMLNKSIIIQLAENRKLFFKLNAKTGTTIVFVIIIIIISEKGRKFNIMVI